MSKKKSNIEAYCERHTSAPGLVLQELERKTYLTTLAPHMVSGHLQGRLLSMISHLLRPSSILEIGTFTGYSAICLAEGLSPGGKLHTIEVNPEFQTLSRHYAEAAGFADRINFYIGDAVELIPTFDFTFDLVFIDAAKISYQQYFDLIIDKMEIGGVILADNLLWSGKVVTEASDQDTNAIRSFAENMHNDVRLENILLPVRDGLMICRKI